MVQPYSKGVHYTLYNAMCYEHGTKKSLKGSVPFSTLDMVYCLLGQVYDANALFSKKWLITSLQTTQ